MKFSTKIGLLFAFLHFVLFTPIIFQMSAEEYPGAGFSYLFLVLDFPFSVLLFPFESLFWSIFHYVEPGFNPLGVLIFHGVLGTFWWFVLFSVLTNWLLDPKAMADWSARVKSVQKKAGIFFALGHLMAFLLFVIYYHTADSDAQWQLLWIIWLPIDFPVSLLVFPLLSFGEFASYLVHGVLGPIWWYFIAGLLVKIFSLFLKKHQNKNPPGISGGL